MDDLKNRTDSLTPPYPTFGEFIRGLLEEFKAKEIGELIRYRGKAVSEETVNSWAANNPPSTVLYPEIAKNLGYDFGERAFYEAATAVGFPPKGAEPEIAAIRTNSALRRYLGEVRKTLRLEGLSEFFGMKHSSVLFTFITSEQNISQPMLELILKRLHEVPSHARGDVLSDLTPMNIIAKALRECRLSSGMPRKAYAQTLGVSHDYLSYFEDRADAPESPSGRSSYTANRERLLALCKKLMSERRRLRLKLDPSQTHREEDPAPPPRHERGPRSAQPAEAERPAAARPQDESAHAGSEPGVKELVQVVQGLQAQILRLEERLNGTAAPKAESPAKRPDETYRSPFSAERWREHDAPIDDARIRLVRIAVMQLCEELGNFAQVRDEKRRSAIQKELAPLMTELIGAVEGFSQDYPSAALKIIESWRKFQADFQPTGR